MPDISMALDEVINHEERAVVALEVIGDALTQWVKLEQAKFDKLYPVKVPRDATVTTVKSEEGKLKESLGDTGESLDDWLGDVVGPREAEVIKNKK